MDKIWGYIVAAFAFLFGAFLYEKDQKDNVQSKLDNADTKAKDGVLQKDQENLQEQLNKDKVDADATKTQPVSQDDLLKFLNKDNK